MSGSGPKNSQWKGGRKKNTEGYVLVLCKTHPYATWDGYVREHRLVMEAHIGRVLLPTEHVHHINEITDDNRIENLMLFSRSEHLSLHAKGQKWSKKRRLAQKNRAKKQWENRRKKK
jgi:hypothetical protein